MTRRCSHCSHNGHNSRTCPSRGFKLFGVRVTDGSAMKKSASMGNLSHYSGGSAAASGGSPSDPAEERVEVAAGGYASDDALHASSSGRDRKKGTPWTEEEHRLFLLGLHKLGKGDWRGIARNFVTSRTPTQVASHAQKYFIRQTNSTRRKRRSSLFDMVADMSVDPLPATDEPPRLVTSASAPSLATQTDSSPFPQLGLALEHESECIESSSTEPIEAEETISACLPVPLMVPAFFTPYCPVPMPFWAPYTMEPGRDSDMHPVLKPTAILPKDPINIDELVGISKLNLDEPSTQTADPLHLEGKRFGGQARQSAFHPNPSLARPDLKPTSESMIHAV